MARISLWLGLLLGLGACSGVDAAKVNDALAKAAIARDRACATVDAAKATFDAVNVDLGASDEDRQTALRVYTNVKLGCDLAGIVLEGLAARK